MMTKITKCNIVTTNTYREYNKYLLNDDFKEVIPIVKFNNNDICGIIQDSIKEVKTKLNEILRKCDKNHGFVIQKHTWSRMTPLVTAGSPRSHCRATAESPVPDPSGGHPGLDTGAAIQNGRRMAWPARLS